MRTRRIARHVALLLALGTHGPEAWARQIVATPRTLAAPVDATIGFTIQTPPDVNLRPLCVDLSLPCGTPRTFPDFGGALSVAAYIRDGVAIVGEASLFDNHWYSTLSKAGQEDNVVRRLSAGLRKSIVPPAVGGRQAKDVRLFGQVLAGRQWSTVLSPRLAVVPGAGIDARFHSGAIVRLELDYTIESGAGRDLSGSRIFIGLVHLMGSHPSRQASARFP